ncbi:MAG: NADH-quinone oxidoreductase subunit L [Cytophagales bacterium]|nr:NADH-quinone oxidoreductase subunit L [Cytophagales bacterium]
MDPICLLFISIFFFPVIIFVFLLTTEKLLPQFAALSAVGIIIYCFVAVLYIFLTLGNSLPWQYIIPWFTIGKNTINISIIIDYQSLIMALILYFIAALVLIYSIEYKKSDRHYHRFFAYVCVFVASMSGIIFSGNLLVTFIFWELVGFNSYLLIGFWYDKPKAVQAAKKAFMVNRISDVFFLITLLILYQQHHSLDFGTLYLQISKNGLNDSHFWASLCFFVGCAGKSAQFPFMIWLPDAMEGPTPVSALIHAATMVAAGIYLLIRYSFLLTPYSSDVILLMGIVTSLLGAYFALFQNDIKKILAFSTVSQLGLMMAAIGVRQYEIAFFHLCTHAFFKAGLFLGAGAVIHGYHHIVHASSTFDKQNIKYMGGIARLMPLTFATFAVFGLALSGVPLFSGHLSKEMIIQSVYSGVVSHSYYWYYVIILLIITFTTSWYICRLIYKIFLGNSRLHLILPNTNINSISDNGLCITLPIMVLAVFSTWLIFGINPLVGEYSYFFSYFGLSGYTHSSALYAIVTAISLIGLVLSYIFHAKSLHTSQKSYIAPWYFRWFYKCSFHQLYMNIAMRYALVHPQLLYANIVHHTDSNIINRLIHAMAIGHVTLAHVVHWADRQIVDGFVIITQNLSTHCARLFNTYQEGAPQKQLSAIFTGIIIIFVLIVIFIV